MSLPNPLRKPTLRDVISNKIREVLLDVHTCMPGTVVAYDAETQLADVQPAVMAKRLDENDEIVTEALPVVPNVPVVFPAAGGFRLTFPVQVGDTVELHFQESSIDVWQQSGGTVDPQDVRRFSVSDAVAVVGLHPNSAPWTGASTSALTMGKDGGPQVVCRADTVELGGSDEAPPTDFAIKGSSLAEASAALTSAMELFFGPPGTGVMGIYATGIAPIADPPGNFTPALITGLATLVTAIGDYQAAVEEALCTSTKVR